MTETDAPKPADETPADKTPTDEPAKTDEKATPWAAIGLAGALIAVVAGGVLTFPEWKGVLMPAKVARQPVAVAPPVDELAVLRAELAATRDRVQALESRPIGGAGADLGPVESRLAAHDAALRALQAQPQIPAKLTEEVDALSKAVAELKRSSADAALVLRLADRVERVEAEMRELQARRSSAASLMLAVGQLREALARAMPFDAELRAVKALSPEDAELAQAVEALKPRAASGIPTLATLTSRFHALAPDVVRAEALPEAESWWRQTLNRMATLVTIRREDGDAAGESPAAIVARAQARLAEGDLAGAVAEAGRLSDGPGEAAGPWLADARARLAADKAVSELAAHVVAQVGARQ